MKIIDVSGMGNSGRTAVTDLLREIDGIHAHHNLFDKTNEQDLIFQTLLKFLCEN